MSVIVIVLVLWLWLWLWLWMWLAIELSFVELAFAALQFPLWMVCSLKLCYLIGSRIK
jgi:hypothetical protein